jgi:hypothetical protein
MAAPPTGLCPSCANVRFVKGANSTFLMCELSRTDPRFPRYPRLPVLKCEGYRHAAKPLGDGAHQS